MIVAINFRFAFRQYCFVSWTNRHGTFAWRFYTRNKRSLNVCMTVLRREQKGIERLHGGFARVQKVLERLHGGFARVQKGLEVSSWGFWMCTKRYWSYFKGFLHVYKRVLKLVQGAFARVQKGIERCKKGLVQWTIWAWSCFKALRLFIQSCSTFSSKVMRCKRSLTRCLTGKAGFL